ncbi:putative F-box/FBD/LRR-repeat protein At1g66290 [Euphorbia lathyris]|uniref:putative F-box/FBD/LRR-repeat protein At1g66290 n=1 Tax=Euphorbia lathyris TaxID=212925 RepID=UPI00331411FD
MAETGGASMVGIEGTCDSENRIQRLKSSKEEDHISALPDFLIHHILSLLPATDLVKTMILSKRWKYQWTHVPVLNFVSNNFNSLYYFSKFINKTLNLHDCSSSIDKFVVKTKFYSEVTKLDSWICFAVNKEVKELTVVLNGFARRSLPEFLFNNSSLVKLELSYCDVVPIGKVNWGSLNVLSLHECSVKNVGGIENVLSGTPMLEYLRLYCCDLLDAAVLASKSVKTLLLDSVQFSNIEISCPDVERLRISGRMGFTSLKLMDLRSSVYVTLEFFFDTFKYESEEGCINLVRQTILQVQHVEKLEIGGCLMNIISTYYGDSGYCIGLPDSVIHLILGFSTDLYYRRPCKWTDVSTLNFVPNEKLVIDSKDIPLYELGPRLSLWIRFAAKKDVKELVLDCDGFKVESRLRYPLWDFFFNNSSLVKMKICGCVFMPNEKVNWESLKRLQIDHCKMGNQAIEHVLSGSPLLECLELHYCDFQEALVVASERLKTIVLREFGKNCPIAEISCPNLESLKIWGNLGSTCLKLTNLPSSVHATLDSYVLELDDISPDDSANLVEEIRKQILHVKELEIQLKRLRS